ncbi:MAG: hypothetical protein ACLSAO_03980 [Anaerovoracaceae bacterium]
MYKVIKDFIDLHDDDYPYSAGDIFPRIGIEVSEKRLKALLGDGNKQGTPLIKKVKEEKSNFLKTKIKRGSGKRSQKVNRLSTFAKGGD